MDTPLNRARQECLDDGTQPLDAANFKPPKTYSVRLKVSNSVSKVEMDLVWEVSKCSKNHSVKPPLDALTVLFTTCVTVKYLRPGSIDNQMAKIQEPTITPKVDYNIRHSHVEKKTKKATNNASRRYKTTRQKAKG